MKEKPFGLYFHFPFCIKKCLYCDFASYAGRESLMDGYLDSMKIEADNMKDIIGNKRIDTIFFGGGTPTLYGGEKLASFLDHISRNFIFSKDIEITIESNPETLDKMKLNYLNKAGINRISMGMQAGQDEHLKSLGRVHSLKDVVDGVNLAREAGFLNINLDLMFGIPNQSLDQWIKSLEIAVKLGVDHISAYSLIVEEDTPFYSLNKKGMLNLPSEKTEREMYYKGIEYLNSHGYTHYEISNFAKPGRECRHNLIYWHNEEYIGFGSSSHSFLSDLRWSNYKGIKQYMDSVRKFGIGREAQETISPKTQRFETLMMGLRLNRGISKRDFNQRFGEEIDFFYGAIIEDLVKEELLVESQGRIYLTPLGRDMQNMVLIRFLE